MNRIQLLYFLSLGTSLFLACSACKTKQAAGLSFCKDWSRDEALTEIYLACAGPEASVVLIEQKDYLIKELGASCDWFKHNTFFWRGPEQLFEGKIVFLRSKKDTLGVLTIREGLAQELEAKLPSGERVKLVYTNPEFEPDRPPIDPPVLRKPILYFYPQGQTSVKVRLAYPERLLHSYPKYGNWDLSLSPDGSFELENQPNKRYYALYWESRETEWSAYDFGRGFVVRAEEAGDFLEEKLSILGLNWRERNEFIMYWLPILESNAYNFVHFSTDTYANLHPLEISPRPDALLRVMMFVGPLKGPRLVEEQVLPTWRRWGFAAVEWGGAVMPEGLLERLP